MPGFFKPSHYEDTIGKDVYSPEDLAGIRAGAYRYANSRHDSNGNLTDTYATGAAPAILHAIFANYNIAETLKNEFPELVDAGISGGDYGTVAIYYYFKGEISKNEAKSYCLNLNKEVVDIYDASGIVLNPTKCDYIGTKSKEKIASDNAFHSSLGDPNGLMIDNNDIIEYGCTIVVQYFKIVSIEKKTLLNKDHKLKDYDFSTSYMSYKNNPKGEIASEYSPRERKNMIKRLSAKLGVPAENIELYDDEDGLLNYRVK